MSDEEIDELTSRLRQEFRATVERLQPLALVGLTEDEARVRVEAAGGVFEAQHPHEPTLTDLHGNRVRATVLANRVVDAYVG